MPSLPQMDSYAVAHLIRLAINHPIIFSIAIVLSVAFAIMLYKFYVRYLSRW